MQIDIIGKGNVGNHLTNALKDKASVNQVNSRTLDSLRTDSDIYLISVSDNAIQEVANRVGSLVDKDAIIAHTSGTTPLSAIKGSARKTGVFYPLQTFSSRIELNYTEIPFFIEGNDQTVEENLKECAKLVSHNVSTADSTKRRDLHIASVFCCNFVNHLWTLADEYLKERDLDFKDILPLIKETTRKISQTSPYDAQTGPAVRHDSKTLESHMQQLEMHPELQEIYSLLSLSVMSHHPANKR